MAWLERALADRSRLKPLVADLLVAAGGLNTGVLIAAYQGSSSPGLVGFTVFPELLLVYLGAALLLWRRRHAEPVFALATAGWFVAQLTSPGDQSLLPGLVLAAYSLGRYAADRAWLFSTGAALASLPALLFAPPQTVALDALCTAAACALGLSVRRWRDPAGTSDRGRRLSRAYEERRQYLIRDLPELFGHQSSVTQTALATALTGSADPTSGETETSTVAVAMLPRTRAWITAVADERQATTELRNVLADLAVAETAAATASWQSRLEILATTVSRGGMPVRLVVDASARELDETTGLTAYQLVRDTLAQAVQHLGRPAARVVLHRDEAPSTVTLTVRLDVGRRDAGPALDALRPTRRRIELSGGRLRTLARPNGHVDVVAVLPVGPR